MTTLNADASRLALAAEIQCATDVTGFGLLGHLFKLARASGVTAVVDHAAVPLIEGAQEAADAGYMPGGSRRNLDWSCRTPTPVAWPRRTCSCSPTRRPRAGCSWPVSCRARP